MTPIKLALFSLALLCPLAARADALYAKMKVATTVMNQFGGYAVHGGATKAHDVNHAQALKELQFEGARLQASTPGATSFTLRIKSVKHGVKQMDYVVHTTKMKGEISVFGPSNDGAAEE